MPLDEELRSQLAEENGETLPDSVPDAGIDPPVAVPSEEIPSQAQNTGQVQELLQENQKLLQENSAVLREMQNRLKRCLNENAEFQVQVRRNMYSEIKELKEQVNREYYIPILKEIAVIYAEYCNLIFQETLPDVTRKNLTVMFEQLSELLENYGAEIYHTPEGEKPSPHYTKILHTVPTDMPELHRTVIKSLNSGIRLGTVVLVKEFAECYQYEASEKESASAQETLPECAGTEENPQTSINQEEL